MRDFEQLRIKLAAEFAAAVASKIEQGAIETLAARERRIAEKVREACADCAKLVMFPCGTIKAEVRNMVIDRIRALDLDKILEGE